MKKFLAFCLMLICVNYVCAESRHVIQQNPYINNPYYRHNNYYQSEILPRDLAALEKYSMNRVYMRENPLKRLERLENLAFGSIQSGDIVSRYKNVETAILSRPTNNIRHSAISTLTNYFRGQTTGFTPTIYDSFGKFMPAYDNFIQNSSNSYGNTRINQYSNGIFGSGYNIHNSNIGNGGSIRILD